MTEVKTAVILWAVSDPPYVTVTFNMRSDTGAGEATSDCFSETYHLDTLGRIIRGTRDGETPSPEQLPGAQVRVWLENSKPYAVGNATEGGQVFMAFLGLREQHS